jgi:outer membrane protein OmpA-like peptidoglycan-associated protein
MGYRIIVMPPLVKPEIGTLPVLRCDLNFADLGDRMIGKQVRIVVYDRDLYVLSDLGLSEGGVNLTKFIDDGVPLSGEPIQPAPFRTAEGPLPATSPSSTGTQLNPTLGSATGVLLKLDGTLQKTKTEQWFLQVANKQEDPNPGDRRILLQLLQKDDRVLPMATIAYSRDEGEFFNTRSLLFRVALLESAAADLPIGKVIASNLNTSHNPGTAPIRFRTDAPDDPSLSVIANAGAASGATSSSAPSAFAPLAQQGPSRIAAAPTPISRVSSPDLTGLYESIPVKDGENSALLLQLNQVGKALVGWFSSPPDFVANLSDIQSLQSPDRIKMQGVLIAYLDQAGPNGIQFSWTKGPFRKFNEMDPDDLLALLRTDVTKAKPAGLLRNIPHTGSDLFLDLAVSFDPLTNTFDRFVRVKRTARWSFLLLSFFPQRIQNLLITEQVTPVPSSYLDNLRKNVGPVGNPPKDPHVAQSISEWRNANKLLKALKREQIAQELKDPGLSDPLYRETIGERLRAHAASSLLSVKVSGVFSDSTETKTYLEWYQDVLAEEQDELDQNPGEVSVVKPIFEKAGIQLGGKFSYKLTFTKFGASGQVIIKAGFFACTLDIKQDLLEFDKDLSGNIKRDKDGKPIIKSRKTIYDTSIQKGILPGFAGFFADVGIGLGFSGNISGGGVLADVEIQSATDLKPKDFDLANFSISAVKGPTASMGNFVSFDSFTSKFFEFRLTNNVVLSTSVTKSMQFNPPKLPSPSDLREPSKYLKGWFDAKFEGKIFDLSTGFGTVAELHGAPIPPEQKRPGPPDKNNKHDVKRQTETFFAVGKADIDQKHGSEDTARQSLEMVLAIDRALFDSSGGRMRTFGYASPEASKQFNKDLSQHRAEVVTQAVREAFGQDLQLDSIKSSGFGEETAEDPPPDGGGLDDPPESQASLAQWKKQHPDQVAKWPDWRRVDLVVEGQVVARIRTEQP